MRQRLHYRCDGGINPAHHYPRGIDVNHDLDTGKVTIEHGNDPKDKFDSVQDAENELKVRYEYVELEFIQSISTKTLDIVLQNKQPFKYENA